MYNMHEEKFHLGMLSFDMLCLLYFLGYLGACWDAIYILGELCSRI